jgi:hypothetical protein
VQCVGKFKLEVETHLQPGEGVPSLLLEHDWWLILLDKGRSFSDSIRGLDGATLELLPSSSSRSASPVTLGDDESRLSPSCCEKFDYQKIFHRDPISNTHFVVVTNILAAVPLSLILLESLGFSPFCAAVLQVQRCENV